MELIELGTKGDAVSATRMVMPKARILIVDNHPLLRTGLTCVLRAQADMEVVGEAGEGLAAVELALSLVPAVVVMDLSMPTVDGLEATRRLTTLQPQTRVVVLSAYRDASRVQDAIEAGAVGYVLKRSGVGELLAAIREVVGGGTFFDPAISMPVAATGNGSGGAPPLSPREQEVLRMIAQGYAMKEIAAALEVSSRTLETYKMRAMDKLGFKSRPDIVRYAVRQGWLERG